MWKSVRWMCRILSRKQEGNHFLLTFQLFEHKVAKTDGASCKSKRLASNERLFKVRTAKALCPSFILLPIDQIHFMAVSHKNVWECKWMSDPFILFKVANVTCFSSWVINSYFTLLWRIHCWWWNVLNFIKAAGTVCVNQSSCLLLRTDLLLTCRPDVVFLQQAKIWLNIFYCHFVKAHSVSSESQTEWSLFLKPIHPFKKIEHMWHFHFMCFSLIVVSWKITSIILISF